MIYFLYWTKKCIIYLGSTNSMELESRIKLDESYESIRRKKTHTFCLSFSWIYVQNRKKRFDVFIVNFKT